MKPAGYPELEQMDWIDVYRALSQEARMPYSVHIPLNWPTSRGLTFCDCAMNAYYLPPPALDSGKKEAFIHHLFHFRMISFGFGDVPSVPDFRRVRLSRRIGGLPLIRAEFEAWGQMYTADYCLSPDNVLHIRMTVRSGESAADQFVVWVNPQMPLESEVHAYHYVPFRWTAECWRPEMSYLFMENRFYSADGLAGSVNPGRFESTWIEHKETTPEEIDKLMHCSSVSHVFPELVLNRINHALRLNIELQPDEEAVFEMSFRLEDSAATEEQLAVSYDEAEKATVAAWRKWTDGLPSMDLGDETENNVFEAIRLCNLQLLLADGERLRPCQGGISERFYVWVWEAMCSLRPMIRLGYFDVVRRVIEFIFSLQDGGCPPIGEFTSVKGAIGTSGPKWANTTGAALLLASEYIRYSNDRKFAEAYLPKMTAAANWIIGELHATRKLNTKTRGILPRCRATDGDVGQSVFTDSWTLSGLKAFGELLTALNHPDAAGITAEAKQYKADLDAVMDAHAKPDGFIPRAFGEIDSICRGFQFTCVPYECCTAHVSSAREPRMSRYLAWLEQNAFQGFFCSPVTHTTFYVGNNELNVMKMYMVLNRPKSAWAAYRTFRRFVVTPDVYLTQERFSTADCCFTAWQPNASNNGRFLDMQISRFYYEDVDGELILFGGFAPFELKHNPSLKGVLTSFGRTDIACTDGHITLKTERSMPAGQKIIVCGKEVVLKETTIMFEVSL